MDGRSYISQTLFQIPPSSGIPSITKLGHFSLKASLMCPPPQVNHGSPSHHLLLARPQQPSWWWQCFPFWCPLSVPHTAVRIIFNNINQCYSPAYNSYHYTFKKYSTHYHGPLMWNNVASATCATPPGPVSFSCLIFF